MPHNIELILTLTGGLTAALALGFVTQKLKLSPIVGYLLAGVIVGPFTRELRNANWLENLSARLAIAADRIEVHWVVCADDQVRFERMRQRNNPRDAAKLVDFAAFSRQYSVEPPLCPHTRVDT